MGAYILKLLTSLLISSTCRLDQIKKITVDIFFLQLVETKSRTYALTICRPVPDLELVREWGFESWEEVDWKCIKCTDVESATTDWGHGSRLIADRYMYYVKRLETNLVLAYS